jgi:hypothetical protein
MWTRDLSHVASAALGAYAFSEIAARVVGDAVAPDTARLLTLVALAVVAATFALVARADARRARADAARAERRARRDARFHAAVLERVARRDPSRDPEDATRVDCIAALARVVVYDAGFAASFGARAIDPSPGLPPLLATPARREAARRASKATEATAHRRLAPPARFTAADIADGAVRVSRALAKSDHPVEVAVSTEALNKRAETSDETRSRLLGARANDFSESFARRVSETTSGHTSARTTTFAAGGCSLDPRDGADRVACVASMLVDLARKQAAFVLREGEPRRAANEGRPCVVRLRLEFGGADVRADVSPAEED